MERLPRPSSLVVALVFAAAMVCTSGSSFLLNCLSFGSGRSPFVMAGLPLLGAAIGLGAMSLLGARRSFTRRGLALAAVSGVFYVVSLALHLQAVNLIGAGPATGLSMAAPLFVVLLGAALNRRRPGRWTLTAVTSIACGALMIARGAMDRPVGFALALASAAVFATSVLITRRALAHAGIVDVAFVAALVASAAALLVAASTAGPAAFMLAPGDIALMALVAVGMQMVPMLGRTWALAHLGADVVRV